MTLTLAALVHPQDTSQTTLLGRDTRTTPDPRRRRAGDAVPPPPPAFAAVQCSLAVTGALVESADGAVQAPVWSPNPPRVLSFKL
jgi:hypothetical protein